MTLRIDGDGCPDIPNMEQIVKQYQIKMIVYTDTDHVMHLTYAQLDLTDTGSQNVDIKLLNDTEAGDIVVTQDYGVAVLALGKKAYALHPKGMEYTNETMMSLLESRHHHQVLRKQKKHVKGPKKRSNQDRALLEELLRNMIISHMMEEQS